MKDKFLTVIGGRANRDDRLVTGDSRARTSIARSVAAIALALGLSGAAYAQFGPGPHWVDLVPPATVPLNGVVEFGFDSTLDGIPEFNTKFVGPTTVHLGGAMDDSVFYPGLRPIDGHKDAVDTEVVSMIMPGVNATAGWTLRAGTGAGVATPTLGTMAESTGNPAIAESFFDVYIEIDGTPWGTLHNNAPIHIAGQTLRLPPGGSDYTVTSALPIGLYDSNQALTAYFTQLTDDRPPHKSIPDSSTMVVLIGMGLMGLAALRRAFAW